MRLDTIPIDISDPAGSVADYMQFNHPGKQTRILIQVCNPDSGHVEKTYVGHWQGIGSLDGIWQTSPIVEYANLPTFTELETANRLLQAKADELEVKAQENMAKMFAMGRRIELLEAAVGGNGFRNG